MGRNRDRDTSRDMVCQGWNSDMESVENGISDMEMEEGLEFVFSTEPFGIRTITWRLLFYILFN